jgi:RHS repeat-associated protein
MAMKTRYTTINGRIISQTKNGVYTRFLFNPLGSVIATVNSAGAVSNRTTYWPYGEVRTGGVSSLTNLGFCGAWGYYTDSSGRMYVRHRVLRPTLGRWQTLDPVWPFESAFGYARSNPIQFVDPSGLLPVGTINCTKAWNDYVVNFCRKCHANPDYGCVRRCNELAEAYYRACGKHPPRPLPSPISPPWGIVPGVGVVPPPSPFPMPLIQPVRPPMFTAPPGPHFCAGGGNAGNVSPADINTVNDCIGGAFETTGHWNYSKCANCCRKSFSIGNALAYCLNDCQRMADIKKWDNAAATAIVRTD